MNIIKNGIKKLKMLDPAKKQLVNLAFVGKKLKKIIFIVNNNERITL